MIAQMTRAVLFAIATVATRAGFRASRSATAADRPSRACTLRGGPARSCRRSSSLRRYLSPILLMRPSRSLPPLDFCSGVSPSQAANCRPERN